MEFQDIISSSLRKDMKELQQFQERLKEIKEECNINIQRLKRNVENINPKEGFVRVMDYLELQLATEEVYECNSKKCLTALKKQFEKFLADTSDCKNEERAFQEFLQEKNYVVNIQGFKDLIIHYLEGIEKGIDARVSHEEVLRIKERDVKERRKNEERMIEFEIMRLEKMIQKDKSLEKEVHDTF
ncbi:hypothetical protein Tco_0256766 [Tanacetum coccineum]